MDALDPVFVAAEKYHNRSRRKHGVPTLKLDPALTAQAQEFADAVARGDPNPPDPVGLGINEYQSTGEAGIPREKIIQDAVTEWYENLKDYNWETPTQSPQNAQLASQIIWKATKSFGIGIAVEGDETVVIALYSPAGNEGNDIVYKQNVPKLLLK